MAQKDFHTEFLSCDFDISSSSLNGVKGVIHVTQVGGVVVYLGVDLF